MLDDEDIIFHYTKIGVAIEYILYEKLLKFSGAINTNDPREYRGWILEPYLEGNYTDEEFRKKWFEVEKIRNEVILKDYKFACFCANDSVNNQTSVLETGPKRRGYNRLRMWAQYGEDFFGVCIAFSASSLLKRLREKLGEEANIYAETVHYDKGMVFTDRSLIELDLGDYMNKNSGELAKRSVKENLKRIFLTKHIDYRDENEYRIVVHDPDQIFEYLDISGCINAVLLGDRTKKVYLKMVTALCDEMNVECREVKWKRGQLQLSDVI